MKQIIVILLSVLVPAMIAVMLVLAYWCFPQDKVMLDDKQYAVMEHFYVTQNETGQIGYRELPLSLPLEYLDTVTLTAALNEPYVAGSVLFFRTATTSVTVTVDGVLLYEFGTGKRLFGRVPFSTWHLVELPEDYVGKEVVITQQMLSHPSSVPITLYPVSLSTKATALVDYFFPEYGFLLFLAVTMAVASLGFLTFSLVLMKKDRKAVKIFFFFLICLHISIWGICNNSMTTLFIGNSYFVYCLHHLLHASLMIPIMLYFGECYQTKYKRLLHDFILFDLIKIFLLLIAEFLTIRVLAENLIVINGILFAGTLLIVGIIIWELIQHNKENRKVAYGLLCLAALGLFEIIRLYVLKKYPITNALYYGMAIMLSVGAVEAVTDYFKEVDDLNCIKINQKETLRLLKIQQNYYKRISTQIHVARQAAHDLNHYNTIMYGVIQSGNTDKLKRLLEETSELYKNMQMNLYTECLEINSILNFTAEACVTKEIIFSPAVRELDSGIGLYDLCMIIGNMLDNAVEGASGAKGKRYIKFFINKHDRKLYIGTENAFSGNINIIGSKIKTTKQDKGNHGLGLSIVSEILKKYNGELWLDNERNIFKALAVIPDE